MRPDLCLITFAVISCEGSERFRALHCSSTVLQPRPVPVTLYLLRDGGSWNILHQKKAVLVMGARLKQLDPPAGSTGADHFPAVLAESGVLAETGDRVWCVLHILAVPRQLGREAALLRLCFSGWDDGWMPGLQLKVLQAKGFFSTPL